MKKIVMILSVLLITSSCGEQTTKKQEISDTEKVPSVENNQVNADLSPHLSFKGVPIDGTLNEYVAKMKQSGFTMLGTENGVAMLEGNFAAYKNCTVGVTTLKGKDLVSEIKVFFPEQKSWQPLASNYFYLKDMLTEKYGEPSESVEKFDTYLEPKDDRMKFHYVQSDQCKYYSIWETDKGSILLYIKGNHSSSFVILAYLDKINGDIVRQKAMDDL